MSVKGVNFHKKNRTETRLSGSARNQSTNISCSRLTRKEDCSIAIPILYSYKMQYVQIDAITTKKDIARAFLRDNKSVKM